MRGEFRGDAEFVLYASKGKPELYSDECFPGVFKYAVNADQKVHLTSKPVLLIQDLLTSSPA